MLRSNGKSYTLVSWIYLIAAAVTGYMGGHEVAMFFVLMAQLEAVDEIEFMSCRLTDAELDEIMDSIRKKDEE